VSGALDLQVAALTARVHRVRDERLGELRAALADQVATLASGARAEARRLLRAAARDKRARVRERGREALAEVDAQRRRHEFDVERRLIEEALAALPDALERRWRDAPARRAWWQNAVRIAAARLVARDWRIEFAGVLDAAERTALAAAVAACGARAELASSAERAGLRISAGASVVDATSRGLLADRPAIAARLLAQLLPGAAP
jgi:hypothetical protein